MTGNFYDSLDWNKMLLAYPKDKSREFSISAYHDILCPPDDRPSFLEEYLNTEAMQRLKGIGLLCGTDWTPLYKNRFYYSRLDHSKGVALIVWNFTHDKVQTLAALFHDISTAVFSHVADFRKGDALTQTQSENQTESTILGDEKILSLLKRDGISVERVSNYHIYPIADNEIPNLSADRLEYMFPSGASLQGSWSLSEIERVYRSIKVLKNEDGIDELGFTDLQACEIYTEKFLETGHVLQLNENKLALQLLAEITKIAINEKIISEEDCMKLSEKEVMEIFRQKISSSPADERFSKLFSSFSSMTEILHTEEALPGHFCVNLKVKLRYINPLFLDKNSGKARRASELSEKCARLIFDFKNWSDTAYGCVKL